MPDSLTISNTSPLLYLNLINRLELLKQMYGEIIIPPAVASELAVGVSQGIDAPEPKTTPWLRVVPVQSQAVIPVITDLGAGEAEVLGLALENPGSRVILSPLLLPKRYQSTSSSSRINWSVVTLNKSAIFSTRCVDGLALPFST